MSVIKVLYNNTVVLKDKKFDEYEKYNKLRQEILEKCTKLTQKDNFVLKFIKDNNNANLYFPPELNIGIFNKDTFNYLKEKIALRGIKEKYKFEVVKVDRVPIWKRPKFENILKETLDIVYQPIIDEIKSDVSLGKLEESQINYSELKNQLIQKENQLNEEHPNVICNNCFEKIIGRRFICSECNNYNLCQQCEKLFFKKQIHNRKHVLIQINSPIDVDIIKYNNIIANNNKEEKKDSKDFFYTFTCLNNGSIEWKNCYILPVRYGDEYLTCEPLKINKVINQLYSYEISLKISVPDTNKKTYEGYFRMFTEEGLPFGQVITIKIWREE